MWNIPDIFDLILIKQKHCQGRHILEWIGIDSFYCIFPWIGFQPDACSNFQLFISSFCLKTHLRSITSANCGKSGGTLVNPAREHLTVFIIQRHPVGHRMSLCAVTFSQNDTAQIRPIILKSEILEEFFISLEYWKIKKTTLGLKVK